MKKRSPWRESNISRAGAAGTVEVCHGDAFDFATRFDPIAFCFSDIEPPELNAKIYELIVPRLVPGGWIVVDNVTSPRYQTALLERCAQRSARRLRAPAISQGGSDLPKVLKPAARAAEC